MVNQRNIGSKNTNISNSNNQITCVVNINGRDENVEVSEVLKAISFNFESEDERINNKLSNKVLINKTNDHEPYQTVKIITSLLKLGIPLVAAYSIAQLTIDRIKELIYLSESDSVEVSTKDIRRMVSLSIQEMDIQQFSYEDIESWNNRYIRRYGHNNKRIRVYYSDNDQTDEISYDYISKKLVADLINDITGCSVECIDISQKYLSHISHEILTFINSCDLYKINYDVLKAIINEIALQPPHPWFISEKTRSDIIKYDIECLNSNIVKVEQALNNGVDSTQYVKIEVLHHASSLILEKYNFFLGCYDLSAFYLLKGLLSELCDNSKWDYAISFSRLGKILEDLVFAHIDVSSLCDSMDRINSYLKHQNINNADFDNLILALAKNALKLCELGNKNDVQNFIKSDWTTLPDIEVVKNLKLLLYSIHPVKKWNLETNRSYFWVIYKSIDSYLEIKNQVLVIYCDRPMNNVDFLDILKNVNAKACCDAIFVISHEKSSATSTYELVTKFLHQNNLEGVYKVFRMDKNIIKEIFNSNNKLHYLGEILLEQMNEEVLLRL